MRITAKATNNLNFAVNKSDSLILLHNCENAGLSIFLSH